MNILIWIITGIIAGWLTGMVMKGRGYGILGDLIIGLLGGVFAGFVFVKKRMLGARGIADRGNRRRRYWRPFRPYCYRLERKIGSRRGPL